MLVKSGEATEAQARAMMSPTVDANQVRDVTRVRPVLALPREHEYMHISVMDTCIYE